MKKIILCATLLLGLVLPAWAKPINVVTTTEDLKSITESIGKEKVKVYSLGRGTQNYHFLSAKPSYMMKAKKADLFIRIGLDLEIGYESLILEGSRNRKIQIGRSGHLDASAGIERLEVIEVVDRSMGDVHPYGNPHYWLDPMNAKIIASNIKVRLAELSPEDEPYFQENLSRFHEQIDKKMEEWTRQLAPYQQKKIATYHRSWIYFTERFGFDIACELEPKPGVPPSPGHLKHVIDVVKRDNVDIILNENFYASKAARFVSGEIGAQVVILPISVGGEQGATDYLTLMDTIVKKIIQGFADAEAHRI
jgi:ABC-type Zn uptake system ZnuABC Zn-binding protein ZnuA